MKNKITFVLSLLFGLMFINGGLNKFFFYMPIPENLPEKMQKAMAAFTEIGWLMPLVGAAEVVGGVLIIIPRFRALGALVILPVMVGIVLTNIVQDTSGLPIALVLSAILVWIMYDNKEKYAPLF
ncbi:MAG: DoxX family protein [Bacteroidota bacterium]